MTLTNMIYNTVITYYLKVDHPDAVKLAAKNVLNEFCEENVAYVELRSTPRTCPGLSFAQHYSLSDTLVDTEADSQ